MIKRIGFYAQLFALVFFAAWSIMVAIYPNEVTLLTIAATSPGNAVPDAIAQTRLTNQ
jgi:hypothetical protein